MSERSDTENPYDDSSESEDAGGHTTTTVPWADIYEPLPRGDYLRILVLHPGNHGDPINCELEIRTHRRAKDKYAAISYVWGDPTDTIEITCNKRTVPITRSLHGALRQFRNPRTIRRLWADALCINQQDVAEKSIQVRNMGRVYQNATKVLVWLGEDVDCDAAEVFKMVKEINNYLDDIFVKYDERYTLMPRLGNKHPIPLDKAPWIRLSRLIWNPWFYRAWTVQECALAKKCCVFWGAYVIDIAEVFEVSLWCIRAVDVATILDSHHVVGLDFAVSLFTSLHCNYKGKHKWQESKPGLRWEVKRWATSTFAKVLDWGRVLKATDPRDHVFAFLACSSAQAANHQPIIEADYSLAKADFWFQVACTLIRRPSEGPWLLNYVKHADRTILTDTDRPSWVPYWETDTGGVKEILGDPTYPHKAGGPSSGFEADPRIGRILETTGFIFDSIVWLSAPFKAGEFNFKRFQEPEDFPCEEPAIDRIWREISMSAESLCSNIDETAFAITLTMFGLSQDLWFEYTRKDVESYRQVVRSEYKVSTHPHEGAAISAENRTRALQIMQILNTRTRGMCLFLTREGRLGLCDAKVVEVGDLCCILAGASVPYLLMPTSNGRYKLVDECYIYGTMEGELVGKYDFGPIFIE